MKRTIPILIISILLTGGFLAVYSQYTGFKNLSPDEMYKRVIKERDYAISQAIARGDYRCCINPPCTMCYMEANQWNNFTAGTCACDDLIAQGKEPCPQCKSGLINDTGSSCEFTSEKCEN